ncbi:GDP-mannose 4,6-dehydratase [Pseudarthrobacter sp. NPDC055928]|uniref:GDP-mannose 4,6-dehydratase n=1 Tax=Pseudarthrobacter sp. NPDC055928 TaxID=3345661 RepID=UPI0035D7D8E0
MKKALVTGSTGQDGSYLIELLLAKGYEVHGTKRRSSSFNTSRLENLSRELGSRPDNLFLHYADLADAGSLTNLVRDVQPDEIYNLGAQSHVAVSFDVPEYTADVTGVATIRLLEAIRASGLETRFYQASSSEMFGSTPPPQNEETPFHPRSPYGAAKVYSYWAAVNYREAYGIHASNGILFNHESHRRGETFVTRKITRAVARIVEGLQSELILGNMDAVRDWGYAPEYVEAMWMMVQQETADDYVIATGEAHSVREFVEAAFARVNLDWEKYVRTDARYERPSEVDALIGDPSKAARVLGWKPKTTFTELVNLMVDEDLQSVRDERSGKLVRIDI